MTANPFGRWRQLSAAIHQLRTDAGLSTRTLGDMVGVNQSTISRIEDCTARPHNRPPLDVVLNLLDALGVPRGSSEWDRLQRWAEDAASKGWWDHKTTVSAMGEGQRDYALVEDKANLDEYAALVVAGLAQHPGYARERILAALPPRDKRKVDGILAARLRRQQVLDTARYRLLLEVQAVYRAGADQLHHLLDLAERPNVSIRVIPADAKPGGHTPRAPFTHATYCHDEPDIVAVDNVGQALLVVDPGEVGRYADLWGRLDKAAMDVDESARFISKVAEAG